MKPSESSIAPLFSAKDSRAFDPEDLTSAVEGHPQSRVPEGFEELFSSLTQAELDRMRPPVPHAQTPSLRRFLRPVALVATGALVALGLWPWTQARSPVELVIRLNAARAAVDDIDLVELSLESDGDLKSIGVFVVENGDAWTPSGGQVVPAEGGAYVLRARAGRLTSGVFGEVRIVATAGSEVCRRVRSGAEAEAAGCATASLDLTVTPPPVEPRLEIVRRDILGGGRDAERRWTVPWQGRVSVTIRPLQISRGLVVHHLWARSVQPSGEWHRISPLEGIPLSTESALELDAKELLESHALEGVLHIYSGPSGRPSPTPLVAPAPGFRLTEVRLVRPSEDNRSDP